MSRAVVELKLSTVTENCSLFFACNLILPVCHVSTIDSERPQVLAFLAGDDSPFAFIQSAAVYALILSVRFTLLIKIACRIVSHRCAIDAEIFCVRISFTDFEGFLSLARILCGIPPAFISAIIIARVKCIVVRHRHIVDGEIPSSSIPTLFTAVLKDSRCWYRICTRVFSVARIAVIL